MGELNSPRRRAGGQRVKEPKAAEKGARIGSGEELYRKIFEYSNDAILVIDPARDAILDANPRACAMLGYSPEELLSIPISAVHPQEMEILQAFAQEVFERGRGWTNELSCMTKSGQELPAEISASTVDVAGNKHIIAMVRDMTERRQAEAAERDLALAEERNRLAREIHDSLAQGLTAIIWQVNAAERVVQAGGSQAIESLDQVRSLARESLQEARRSVWDLRSGPLQRLSLIEALQQEASKISGAGIQISFDATGDVRILPAGVESALLRICQESLANVLKHANAKRVSVKVGFDDTRVHLRVSDDGIGFNPQIPSQWDRDRGGFGLISMRERAQLLGGELNLKSTVGHGTLVEASLPVQK